MGAKSLGLRPFMALCAISVVIWLVGSFSAEFQVATSVPAHGSDASASQGVRTLARTDQQVNKKAKYVEKCLERELAKVEGTYSVLEIVDPELPLHHLARAGGGGDAVWLASLPESSEFSQTAFIPGVKHLSKAKLKWLYQTPQLFDVLFLLDLDLAGEEYAKAELDWLAMLLSLAKRTYVRSKTSASLEDTASLIRNSLSKTQQHQHQAGLKARVTQVEQSNVIRVDLLYMERPVLKHYRDQRPMKQGGSCPVYSLFYQAVPIHDYNPLEGDRVDADAEAEAEDGGNNYRKEFQSHQWLCILERVKGSRACDLGSPRRCIAEKRATNTTISHSWIGADIIAGLGVNQATGRYIMRSFMGMAIREDCFLWNVCLASNLQPVWCEFRNFDLGHSTIDLARGYDNNHNHKRDRDVISKHANSACVKFELEPEHMLNSACCVDMALLRLFGCEKEKAYIHHLSTGQTLDESVISECRRKHLETYLFRPVKFKANFLENVQTAFIFGEGLEPRRMSKQELTFELKLLGVPNTNSMNKKLLIEKLEEERLKVADMTEPDVVKELRRYHMNIKGEVNELKYRLQNIRNNNYLTYKLQMGGKVKRETILPDMDVEKMSKEMLQKELERAYSMSSQGTKQQLIERVEGARKSNPKKFEKYMDELNDLASLSSKVTPATSLQKPLSEMSKQELSQELERLGLKPKGSKYDMLEQLMKEKQKKMAQSISKGARGREGGGGGGMMENVPQIDVVLLSDMSKSDLVKTLGFFGVSSATEKGGTKTKTKEQMAKLLFKKSLERLNIKVPKGNNNNNNADSINKTELQKILLMFGFSSEGSKELLQSRLVHHVLLQILQ